MSAVTRTGLSPRVRGNHIEQWAVAGLTGSIPARAGEPEVLATQANLARVYPRACGGTGADPCKLGLPWGLSPRVRGNLVAECGKGVEQGSIPARAGEPTDALFNDLAKEVYPRACGGTGAMGLKGIVE